MRFRRTATTLAGFAFVAVLVASGESNTATKVGANGATTEEAEVKDSVSKPHVFLVGDLVEIGDWRILVHAVTDPLKSSNEFIGPSSGSRWVAADVEVTNTASEPALMSALMCLELQDSFNQNYSIAITAEDFPELDGEVASSGSRRGVVVFEVPQSASGLVLKFSCDLFSTGQALIRLN